MKMELRVNTSNMTTNEDGTLTVEGYVNETGQFSNLLGRDQKFREVIKPGVWTRAIEKAKEIHFLAEHDKSKILASTRNGSLQLREDEKGLYMKATISPTSWGKDYYQLIKDGILQNMSFGFRAVKDAWRNMGSYFERTVNELELFEVSVVRDPAYAQSSISARGIDLVEDEVPQTELNVRSIEIRSEADIEAIAKKIFEMIAKNVKIAEGHDEEKDDKEEVIEDQQTLNETEVIKDEEVKDEVEKDATSAVDKVDEEVVKDEKVEEVEENKKEEIVDETPAADPAAKLRDFINQYKQEEK